MLQEPEAGLMRKLMAFMVICYQKESIFALQYDKQTTKKYGPPEERTILCFTLYFSRSCLESINYLHSYVVVFHFIGKREGEAVVVKGEGNEAILKICRQCLLSSQRVAVLHLGA